MMNLLPENLVTTLTILFIIISLLFKFISEKIELFFKGNIKYRIINSLAPYIYYGPNVGVETVLKLDSPTNDVFQRRLKGQKYLASKLDNKNSVKKYKGKQLSASLVDCRFSLAKVCMPLLRELEFDNIGRNYIVDVKHVSNSSANNQDDGAAGMLNVQTETDTRLYVGNDAVHTFGVKAFYEPIQEEIARRMSQNMLRFCPTAMNGELEKNVELVKRLTGMDQVRYSLSGSEAVDAALKDIRATTSKQLIVRFISAYHGHTSGINFLDCHNHIFLPECSKASIDFIEKYHYRIAAVIVNPMQHFTGVNKPSPPGEKVTHSSRIRKAVPKEEYARWLHDLQEKCCYCTKYLTKVALVIDDIYFAFRTPELLSTNYFAHPDTKASLKPDVIILGKALAAGYPLSVVAGRDGFLNSYDKKFLLKLNKTVGTFAAWNGGIVASNVFLEALEGGGRVDGQSLLKHNAVHQIRNLVSKCDAFTDSLNTEFARANVPVRIRNFSNTFSIDFLSKSLYNSRYPQYLLAEGIFLGNYSTGKFNLSADITKSDLKVLESKFVAAATRMQQDGYFEPLQHAAKRKFIFNLIMKFIANYAKIYYNQIMQDKHIDIEVSHNHPVNKFGHFWSSIGMILFAYPLMFWYGQPLSGGAWFFATHAMRQTGHFFYEHQDRDIEKLKFGHKDRSKKEAVAFLILATAAYIKRAEIWSVATQYINPSFLELSLEQYVSLIALFTVVPHFVEITYQYGWLRGLSWVIKILTDPFTDLIDFYTHALIHPKWFLDFKEQTAIYRLDIKTKKIDKME